MYLVGVPHKSILIDSFPLLFLFFVFYALKKLGHLNCRISHSLDFADSIPLYIFNTCIFCKLFIRSSSLIRLRFNIFGKCTYFFGNSGQVLLNLIRFIIDLGLSLCHQPDLSIIKFFISLSLHGFSSH